MISLYGATQSLLLLCLWTMLAGASDKPSDTPFDSTSGPFAPTALKTVDSVRFSDAEYFSYVSQPRCDQDGNVFVVLVPEARRSPPKNPQGSYAKPSDVLGIASDGEKKSRYQPSTIPAFASADEVSTESLAVDSSGTLYLLVWVRTGKKSHFYIVLWLQGPGLRPYTPRKEGQTAARGSSSTI